MTEKKKRNRKQFVAPTSQDFKIRDDNGIVGHIRIKPSAIAWKPKGAQGFYQLSIDQFAEFAVANGKEQQK